MTFPILSLSLSKHLAHNLGNLLLLGKIGVFHNRRNASSRLLLLISKHLILCIYLVFRILACSRRLNASNLFLSLILHLGNLFLIVQLHFSKLFLILKSGVNHTSRGSISTSTLPSIKLRKCSSKIITSILSFISGRLATKSNQIKQLIRNGRSASLQRTFKKSFTSFSHSTRNKTRDGLIRVRNIRALNGRFNTSITHAYSIVIGSKHITLNATGGDNQKEIAEMQNETQKEIAGIQSATSRQNTKDQVYAQNEMLAYQQKESTARVASIMENTNLSKQQQVSEIMRQMLTQAQTAGQYFTNDQIKEMTRKVSAEVDLVHQQTQNQRYGSSHIGATAKDISNVVTDAASGVVDIFHGIDKAVADTWNNFWKDGKADGIGSNLSRK